MLIDTRKTDFLFTLIISMTVVVYKRRQENKWELITRSIVKKNMLVTLKQ